MEEDKQAGQPVHLTEPSNEVGHGAAKHTPGPWLVSASGATVYALHGWPQRNRFSALVQSGRRDDAGEEERMASATLMAAAPELLQDSRVLVNDVAGCLGAFREEVIAAIGFTNWQLLDTRVAQMKRTIAKATGAVS